jgi:bifunctional non-homologous end joining protein LigD
LAELNTDLPVYSPMLASRWPDAFSDPGWAFEVKWDGVRAIAAWDGRRLEVRSRTGRPIGSSYPELDQLAGLAPCILDGEIVAFDDEGRPSFGRLQQRQSLQTPISFMAFDLLFLGASLVNEPWTSRREHLAALELPTPYVVPEPVPGDGDALWMGVEEQSLEGMVAKRLESTYQPGLRSADWRKVTRVDQVRAVLGGYLPGEGSRASTFGSLLLGLLDGDRLRYIGSVGTGFTGETLPAIRSALDELATAHSPFHSGSELPSAARFVEPTLVALVEFKEWTRASKLRAPSFKGFTDDDSSAITWAAEGPPTP